MRALPMVRRYGPCRHPGASRDRVPQTRHLGHAVPDQVRDDGLRLRGLRAARTAAAAATATVAGRVVPALLEASAGLAGAIGATVAVRLARRMPGLDAGFAACLALRLGAGVAPGRLAAARRAPRSADRLDVPGDDRDLVAQPFGQRHLVERHSRELLDVAQVLALVVGAEAER